MKELVSIIIPLYNSEKFVADTISSALAQSYRPIEIIIIDDGSTDNSLAIATKFQSEEVKIFSQQNSGASIARNKGLEIAKGEYIQFLDADDLISNNKIAEQVLLLDQKPNYIGLCHTLHFYDGTDPKKIAIEHEWFKVGSEDNVDFLIKLYGGPLIGPHFGGMIQPNAWLTPRDIIDKAGPWNEMRNPDDDGEFFCRVLLNAQGIIYASHAINYYRKFKTSTSLSAQNNREAIANIFKSAELKAQYLLAKTDCKEAKMALSRLFWEVAINAYPKFINITNSAIAKANKIHSYKPKNLYTHTSFYKLTTKYFGWKTSAWISYIKQYLKQLLK